MKISVEQAVTAKNDAIAAALRRRLAGEGIFCLNIVAGPGAGKTALIERTIEGLDDACRVLVVEGDPHTRLDSDRITALGARCLQINTLGGCHLDARMIVDALAGEDLGTVDLLFIENVGNLLCPAAWDLGEDVRLVVASLPEGADKPLKYPETFGRAGVLVINKIDLEPVLPATTAQIRESALAVNPSLTVFPVSCTRGDGLPDWLAWIGNRCRAKRRA